MSGETNLDKLLRHIDPVLHPDTYVFHSSNISFEKAALLHPVMIFTEEEGTTIIIEKAKADQSGITYHYPSRMITLNVHSSLDAIGFLANITEKLAAAGISVNPVSAHYHDHLFVPEKRSYDAMQVLETFKHV